MERVKKRFRQSKFEIRDNNNSANMSISNKVVRDIILKKELEGLTIENQLGYYRLIKYGLMKQLKYDEASELRELDKECVRILKEREIINNK